MALDMREALSGKLLNGGMKSAHAPRITQKKAPLGGGRGFPYCYPARWRRRWTNEIQASEFLIEEQLEVSL